MSSWVWSNSNNSQRYSLKNTYQGTSVCLSIVLCHSVEYFFQMATSSLLVKDCKRQASSSQRQGSWVQDVVRVDRPVLGAYYGPWAARDLSCDSCCDTGPRFLRSHRGISHLVVIYHKTWELRTYSYGSTRVLSQLIFKHLLSFPWMNELSADDFDLEI